MERMGYVYVQTNDAAANAVVVYRRDAEGRLERRGSYLTGGRGSGRPHLPSQGSVVLARDGLFVTNAGSDDMSVLRVHDDALELVDRAPSGGSAPRSVTVDGDRVYVLNTGDAPSVVGFRFDGNALSPIEGATVALGASSDPAQLGLAAGGRAVLVTDRASNAIHSIALDERGAVTAAAEHASAGMTPYGFDVRADGTVLVTEAAGAQRGKASASSYRLGESRLDPISSAVGNTRSEVCWAVIGKDGRVGYVTNFGDGTISSYEIADDGSIELRDAIAATTVDDAPGIRDEALSRDGRFLYALHADTGSVYGWRVDEDGALAPLGSANGLPLTAAGLAAS